MLMSVLEFLQPAALHFDSPTAYRTLLLIGQDIYIILITFKENMQIV